MQLPKLSLIASTGVMLLVFAPPVLAFTSANQDTRIDIGGIDIAPTNTPVPTVSLLRKPTPKIVLPQRQETTIKQGDKIQVEKRYFTLSVSGSDIDYGTMDPTNPVLRTHRFSIDPGSARGYSLFAYENHHLGLSDNSAFIPDSTCDDGNCTESISSLWENTLTYGLGVRCDLEEKNKDSCLSSFATEHSYKQLADLSQKEPGTVLMSSQSDQVLDGKLTYKVNVPGTQKSGDYTNAVVLIAAPGY